MLYFVGWKKYSIDETMIVMYCNNNNNIKKKKKIKRKFSYSILASIIK